METDSRTIDARAVANYLLSKADVDQKKLDPLQLQKLVYIAHGWHLGLLNRPLFAQRVEAWPYGPVIEDVYHAFKRFGQNGINGRAVYFDRERNAWEAYSAELSDDT